MKFFKRILVFLLCFVPLTIFVGCDNSNNSSNSMPITTNRYTINSAEALNLIKLTNEEIEELLSNINSCQEFKKNDSYSNIVEKLARVLNNSYVTSSLLDILQNSFQLGKIYNNNDNYFYVFSDDNTNLNIILLQTLENDILYYHELNIIVNNGSIEQIYFKYINNNEPTSNAYDNENNILIENLSYDKNENTLQIYSGKPINPINDNYLFLTNYFVDGNFRSIRWEYSWKANFDFATNSASSVYSNNRNEPVTDFKKLVLGFNFNECYSNLALIIASNNENLIHNSLIFDAINLNAIAYNATLNTIEIRGKE